MKSIEYAYAQLAELPIEFNRKDVEEILFERSVLQLKKEGREKTEANLRGQYYSLLVALVLDLDAHKYHRGINYYLDKNDKRKTLILKERPTWTPGD